MPSFTVFKGHESGNLVKTTTTKPDELTEDYVLLRVTASGLCGTDLHFRHTDMVLGHEGIGVVEAVGPNARHLKKGDHIGWGYEVDSCGHCVECLQGSETFCAKRQIFASHAIWRESWLHRIPDALSDVAAAPLQYGGGTIFQALLGIKPIETVGILGVGGLGHLAIQFAAKMGCRVVMLSGSDRKREEAFKLGAHEFVATRDVKELSVSAQIDQLLVTAAVPPDWSLLVLILAPRAAIYPLTVNMGNFSIPYMALISRGIHIMLEFAALHHVEPITETFPMTEEKITEAMDKLDCGEMYYRAVLIPQ
ncbi:chaperonin 10-like protein [Aspergillus pseudodeflectus]|uniref:Chaperonin 10-like protein n=1 Tax=Aspergillus pseudodeflectus TaxID=176178 RepID=A0ABR4K5M7_9EURO